MEWVVRLVFLLLTVGFLLTVFGRDWALRLRRKWDYSRGRQLKKGKPRVVERRPNPDEILRFGNSFLPESALTGHCLAAGTSGSGKSLVQRLFLAEHLRRISPGSDSRVFIYDAKSETTAFLRHIGVSAPIYSLNPFESSEDSPVAVAWDIGKDITSPARANNLSYSMVTGEATGANGYFVKAARIVVSAIIKSFIRHSGSSWRFSDLIYATSSWERMLEVLNRDEEGMRISGSFLAENTTGYNVSTTVIADMELYSPVAALWQRAKHRLSIRDFLKQEAIVLMGENETASATLDVLNQQIFGVYVEEVLAQTNSSTRRNGLWIDEAQYAKPILQSEKLQSFAAKARSKGGWMLIAFQDVEGFRLAAGDSKAADSIIAQCNNKVLLRMESFESAEWASKLAGQFETIEVFRSEGSSWRQSDRGSEQRVVKDVVLPSEFYVIPETDPSHGLSGYFLSSKLGARSMTVAAIEVQPVVVDDETEKRFAIVHRPESDQWITKWTLGDKQRLGLVQNRQKRWR